MAIAKDILTDSAGDLQIANGDFVVGNSDQQHVLDLLEGGVGHYKQFPLACIGVFKYLNGSTTSIEINSDIRAKLAADGYDVTGVDVRGNTYNITGERITTQ